MPQTIVIFGASGDLTSRKLIPAIYSLHQKKRLPADTSIVGFSRTQFSHDAWRQRLAESTAQFAGPQFDAAVWNNLAPRIFYVPGSVDRHEDFLTLAKFLDHVEGGQPATRVYYLSMAPQSYETAVANLGAAKMAGEDRGPRRVVVEKPFGTDLATARRLNQSIHKVFAESQVYRIDHYLGKETVQNVLVLRFANTIFEPVWNRNYVNHVEITAAESLRVGHRAGYYDKAGVLRDMLQAHLLPLLALWPWRLPSASRPTPCATRSSRFSARQGQCARGRRCPRHPPRPISRIPRGARRAAAAKRPPSPPSSCWSTIGAGRACPSIFAAARPCPARRRSWSSNFVNRPTCSSATGRAIPRGESPRHPDSAVRGHPVPFPVESARRGHAASHERT